MSADTVTASGSSTARTLANRAADQFSPLDYGAVCDGTTDDTTALQSLVTAVNSATGNANIVWPRNTCTSTETMTFNMKAGENLSLIGQGVGVSKIQFNAQVDGIIVNYVDPKYNTVYIANLTEFLNIPHKVLTVPAGATVVHTVALSAAAAVGATVIAVADTTGLAVNQHVTTSCGGTPMPGGNQVTAINGTTVTLAAPLRAAVSSGCNMTFGTAIAASLAAAAPSGATAVTVADARGIAPGQDVIGQSCNFRVGERVSSISGTTVTLTLPLTAALPNGCQEVFGIARLTVADATGIADMITQAATWAAQTATTDQPYMGEAVAAIGPSAPSSAGVPVNCPVSRPDVVTAVQGNDVIFNTLLTGDVRANCVFEVATSHNTGLLINGKSLQQEAIAPDISVTISNFNMDGSTAGLYWQPVSWLKGISINQAADTDIENFNSSAWTMQGYAIGYDGASAHDGSGNPSGHTYADAHHIHSAHITGYGYGVYSNSPYVEGIFCDQCDMASVGYGIRWSNSGYTDQLTVSNAQIAARYAEIDAVDLQAVQITNSYLIAASGDANYTQNTLSAPGALVVAGERPSLLIGQANNAAITGDSIAFHGTNDVGLGPLRECAISTSGGQTNSGVTITGNSMQGNAFTEQYFFCVHGNTGGHTITGNSASEGFSATDHPVRALIGYDTSCCGFLRDVDIGNGSFTSSQPPGNICTGNQINGIEQYDCLGHFSPRAELAASPSTTSGGVLSPAADSLVTTQSTTLTYTLHEGIVPGHRIYVKNLGGGTVTIEPDIAATTTVATAAGVNAAHISVVDATGFVVGQDLGSNCFMPSGVQITSISGTTIGIAPSATAGLSAGCNIMVGNGSIDGSTARTLSLAAGVGAWLWWQDKMGTWISQ